MAPLKRRVGILRLRLHGGERVVFSGGEIDELQAVAAQVGDRPETAGLECWCSRAAVGRPSALASGAVTRSRGEKNGY